MSRKESCSQRRKRTTDNLLSQSNDGARRHGDSACILLRTFFSSSVPTCRHSRSVCDASASIARVLITTPGFPLTRVRSGTEFITTLPALTTLPLPTSTPGPMNDCAATQQPSPNVMPRTIKSKVSLRWSCEPVHKNERCETQTLDPIVTGARLRIMTSSPSQT